MVTLDRIDTRQFDSYTRELAKRLDAELPEVIRSEAASVLKIAGGLQQKQSAKPKKIREDTRWREMKTLEGDNLKVTASRKSGRIWASFDRAKWILIGHHDLSKNFKFQKDGFRIGKKDYQRIWKLWQSSAKEARAKIKTSLQSQGLGAKSWYDLVQMIGYDPESLAPKQRGVSKAIDAKTRYGKNPPRMGYIYDEDKKGKYTLTVGNTSKIALDRNGKENIQAAIRRRAAAFRNNVKHEIFEDADQIAARYPGIKSRLAQR